MQNKQIKFMVSFNQYNQSQGRHCLKQMLTVFRVSSGTSKDNIKAFLDMLQPFLENGPTLDGNNFL